MAKKLTEQIKKAKIIEKSTAALKTFAKQAIKKMQQKKAAQGSLVTFRKSDDNTAMK